MDNARKKAIGTGLQAYVKTDFKTLTRVLGKALPPSGDDKIRAEWVLTLSINGRERIATIYDYKGDCKLDSTICEWHVGGFNFEDAATVVEKFLSINGGVAIRSAR